jgi:hypothetical protein
MSMSDARICREHIVENGYCSISLRPLADDPIWHEAMRYLQMEE